MRQGHLALIFLTIYSVCFLFLNLEQKRYDHVLEEKQRVEHALVRAMSDAGRNYQIAITAPEDKRKRTLEHAFFESWYVSMGVFGDVEKQEQLRMHLPMLILAEEDGAYFYYTQESWNGKEMELKHVWSEKVPYTYLAGDTEADKKNKVAAVLEKLSSEIITNHSYIASQYGISYSFYVPDFLQNSATSLEFPMIFAVFQGWPLTASGDIVYNNCLDVGMYLQKTESYVVTKIDNTFVKSCQYHVESCGEVNSSENTVVVENVTEKEAIMEFGAYPCEQCIP